MADAPLPADEIATALRTACDAYHDGHVTRALWHAHMVRLWDTATRLGLDAQVMRRVDPNQRPPSPHRRGRSVR